MGLRGSQVGKYLPPSGFMLRWLYQNKKNEWVYTPEI